MQVYYPLRLETQGHINSFYVINFTWFLPDYFISFICFFASNAEQSNSAYCFRYGPILALNTIMHMWFISFNIFLDFSPPGTFIKCEKSWLAEVQMVPSKIFSVLLLTSAKRDTYWRDGQLGAWCNLFKSIWMRMFASSNKWQIALCLHAPTILIVTENSDSQYWSWHWHINYFKHKEWLFLK